MPPLAGKGELDGRATQIRRGRAGPGVYQGKKSQLEGHRDPASLPEFGHMHVHHGALPFPDLERS